MRGTKHRQHRIERLSEVDRAFAAAFADYQHRYGCRALRYELADPTLAESPTLILGLVRDQIARGYDGDAETAAVGKRRASLVAEARAVLAERRPADRERIEWVLRRAEIAYPTQFPTLVRCAR
jgi:pyruvate,water dikinase